MRKLPLLLLFFLLHVPGTKAATPALVSGQVCTNNSGTAGSVTCTFPNNLTAGNLLYICLDPASNNGGTANPGGTTWTGDSGTFTVDLPNSGGLLWDGGSRRVWCYHVLPVSGGGKVITATCNTPCNYSSTRIVGAEFTNVKSFDLADTGAVQSGSTAPSGSAITTTANGDLVIGAMGAQNSSLAAAGGFTGVVTSAAANANWMLEWQVQTSAGSITATSTSASGFTAGHTVAFKPVTLGIQRRR